jgi:signal transduction histidine kinase
MRSNAVIIRRAAARLPLPRPTARLRLTFYYGGLFLLSGAALLTITNVLFGRLNVARLPQGARIAPDSTAVPTGPNKTGKLPMNTAGQLHDLDLHKLLVVSAIAFGIVAVLSIALGWVVAGRVLRPVRNLTEATQRISANNLHERLPVDGPDDEFTDLGRTLNHLFARLETAFDAQRRFVANASHELRTPLALGRAMLEVALDDPHATVDSLRSTCREAVAVGEQQEDLIEALLTLARGQSGLDSRTSVDLAALALDVTATYQPAAACRGVTISTTIEPVNVHGDPRLIERLVANLTENAIRHNLPDGHVDVTVNHQHAQPALVVANTGPHIAEAQIDRLLQPFQRLTDNRPGDSEGHGLGLSIVHAIAAAHDADLQLSPRPGGGLTATVTFPDIAASSA